MTAAPIRTHAGIALGPVASLDARHAIDTLVVCGGSEDAMMAMTFLSDGCAAFRDEVHAATLVSLSIITISSRSGGAAQSALRLGKNRRFSRAGLRHRDPDPIGAGSWNPARKP